MHIVHVTPAVTIGGLWRILQAAAKASKHKPELTIISIFDLDDCVALRHLDINVIQLGQTIAAIEMRSHISNLICSVLRQLKPDIVQTHHFYSDIYALPAARNAQVKAIRMVHGVTQATKSSPLKRERVRTDWTDDEIMVELELESACSGTIVVSSDLKRRLVRYGFESSKIGVLYPGVDLDELERQAHPNIRKEDLTIGFVGRLEMVKNPLILPRVAIELSLRGHYPRFLIIGDGRQREELAKSIITSKVSQQFDLIPITSDLYKLYGLIDILVLPSFSEGLPLVLIEAMALGIPPVAANVGGIPEVINDGLNGFLCQPDDALNISAQLARLIENKQLRALLGQAGKETIAQKFTMGKHLRTLHSFYTRTMADVPLGL